jgi:hypothetical protein
MCAKYHNSLVLRCYYLSYLWMLCQPFYFWLLVATFLWWSELIYTYMFENLDIWLLRCHLHSLWESPKNQDPPLRFIVGSGQWTPIWAVDGVNLPIQGLEFILHPYGHHSLADNITQPNTLKCGAEFDAAPMRLPGRFGCQLRWVRVGWGKNCPLFFW